MKEKSVKKNYVYNLILTTVNLVFPLITSPYLSSVLGAANIGKVNYATSIVNWFILFAGFGIPRYGIREIARKRDNRKVLSEAFWNLILIQLLLSVAAIAVYFVMIFSAGKFRSDIGLYLIMVLMIILSIFSIDWFYQGIEEYGYITIRNILFKIVSIALMFALVRDRKDYLLYATINVFGLTFNNVLNYIHAKKYVDKKIYNFKIGHYLRELKVYFMTTLIIAIYTSLDQTLVGSNSEKDLAYYMRSKSLQGIGLSITNSVVTVFIPRTAYLINKNYEEYKKAIRESINYIYVLSMPCIAGMFMLSDEFMILLGGEEFLPAGKSLRIICFLILVNTLGSWQVNQILIPHKLEKLALNMQTIGALVSFSLNLILIRKFSYIGAAFTWVATELFLAVTGAILIRKKCKDIRIKYFTKSFMKYLVSVLAMSAVIYVIKFFTPNYIMAIICSLITAPIVYFGMLILLKDSMVINMIEELMEKVKSKAFIKNRVVSK